MRWLWTRIQARIETATDLDVDIEDGPADARADGGGRLPESLF